MPGAGLLWRKLGERFRDWLSVPAPHLRHDPGASLVWDWVIREPAARVGFRVVRSGCLAQVRIGKGSRLPARSAAAGWPQRSLAGTPAARRVVTMVKTACLSRSGPRSPDGPVITYRVRSRPSVPRTARSARWLPLDVEKQPLPHPVRGQPDAADVRPVQARQPHDEETPGCSREHPAPPAR